MLVDKNISLQKGRASVCINVKFFKISVLQLHVVMFALTGQSDSYRKFLSLLYLNMNEVFMSGNIGDFI